IIAQRAYLENYDIYEGTFLLKLENGTIAQTSRGEVGYVLTFDSYSLSLSVTELLKEFSRASSTKWEMNMKELWRASHEARTKEERSRYGVEFHNRIALPFISIILALMMLFITAVSKARRFYSKSSSILIAFSLFILFYLLTALGKGLAENGIITPAMAVYVPVGIFCTGLFWLWQKMKFKATRRQK
ncbi:MAG: LptF/LptG family permease, partial [Thermodesulforhabdaceae bacterium]